MAEPQLVVVAGDLPRGAKPKVNRSQDALAKRWRNTAETTEASAPLDVIPLLDGWIRRLEREAGAAGEEAT
jgi:hypothetical protein